MVVGMGSVFAEEAKAEKESFIRPTFGIGYASVTNTKEKDAKAETSTSWMFGIDFIHQTGLTIGTRQFTYEMKQQGQSGTMAFTFSNFGIGYTYAAESFCVGGKAVFMPVMLLEGLPFGVNIDGSFWVAENLGLTVMFDMYFPKDHSIWALGLGLSFKH